MSNATGGGTGGLPGVILAQRWADADGLVCHLVRVPLPPQDIWAQIGRFRPVFGTMGPGVCALQPAQCQAAVRLIVT